MKKLYYLLLAFSLLLPLQGCNRDDPDDDPTVDSGSAGSLENDFSISISERYSEKSISVNGTPYNPKVHKNYLAFTEKGKVRRGDPSDITAVTIGDNLHVMWINQEDSTAHISVFDRNLTRTNEFTLLRSSVRVYGFDVIPNQGYAIVYSHGEKTASSKECNLLLTDFNGKQQALEFVMGSEDKATKGDRWIGWHFEGRLTYNRNLDQLILYCTTSGQWSDEPGVDDIHQAGYYRVFDKSGKTIYLKDWYKGHVYQIRAVELSDNVVLGIAGDANPLGVGCVVAKPNVDSKGFTDIEVFKSSQKGNAHTRVGGMVAFPEIDQFAVSYSGQEVTLATESWDVGVSFYSSSGALMSNLILPRPEGKEGKPVGINPVKLVRFGDDKVLVSWLEQEWDNPEERGAYFSILNTSGELLLAPETLGDMAFHLSDDFIVYPDGKVGWVDGDGSQLRFHTIRVK